MRASDHPAARPRTTIQHAPDHPPAAEETAKVFRAAAVEPDRLAAIAAIPDEAINTSDISEATEEQLAAAEWREPPPTREPIDSAPLDGTHVLAFWGESDKTGRLVRWRQGRHFNNRRWVPGGAWSPADGMIPLPAEPPTEWLKPYTPPEPEREPIEAEAAD